MALGTPIEELLVAARVDTSGVTRGLATAVAQLQAFDRQISQITTRNLTLSFNATPAIKQIETVQGLIAKGQSGFVFPALTLDIAPFDAAVDHVLRRFDEIQAKANSLGATADTVLPALPTATAAIPIPPDAAATLGSIEVQARRTADAIEALATFTANVVQELIRLTSGAEAAGGALNNLEQAERATSAVPTGQFSAFAKELAASEARLRAIPGPVDAVAASMARGTAGALAYGQGLARLATQQRAVAESGAIQAKVTQGFAEASRQASLGPFARGLEEIRLTGAGAREEIDRIGKTSTTASHGVRQAAGALTSLATQSIGVNSAVGRLAQSVLFLGTGFAGAEGNVAALLGRVAVGAGIVLALAKAYEFLTTAEREAAARRDTIIAGLLEEAKNANAAAAAAERLAAAIRHQADAQESLLVQAARPILGVAKIITDPFGTGLSGTRELQRRQTEEQANAVKALNQATRDLQAVEVTQLTATLGLHGGTNAARERAVSLVKALAAEEGALGKGDERRLDIAKQRVALQQALTQAEQQRVSALAAVAAIPGADTAAVRGAIAAEIERNRVIRDNATDLDLVAQAQQNINTLIAAGLAPLQRQQDLQHRATQEALAAFQATKGLADLQRAAGVTQELTAQIAAYRRLEAAAGLSADAVQALADKRHGLELERKAADDAFKAFANIGGLGKARPDLDFKVKFDFTGTGQALTDVLTGKSDEVISGFLGKLLGELKTRNIDALLREAGFQATNGILRPGPVDLPSVPAGPSGDSVDEAVERTNKELLRTSKLWRDATAAAERHQSRVNDNRSSVEKLNDAIHETTRGIGEIVAAATGLGLIDETASNAIGSVLALGDALASVAESATTGNILGAVAAGVGVLGSIFGQSASDQERDRLIAQNNDRLAELNANFDALITGAGALPADLALVEKLDAAIAAARQTPSGAKGTLSPAIDKALQDTGLSIREFEKIIKDATGIEILDSKGRVISEAFDQATEALNKMIFAQTHFVDTLADQTTRLDLGARLRGEDTSAAANFGREVTAASGLSDAVREAFEGVDTKNEAALRAATLGLFEKFDAGQISAQDLGGLTKEDFLKFLADGADALDAFKSSVDQATASTLNLPQGFKLAALAFAASDTGPFVPPAAQPPGPPPSIDPGALRPDFSVANADVNAKLDVIASQSPGDLLAALEGLRTQSPPDLLDALSGVGSSIDDLAAALGLTTTSGTQASTGTSTFPGPDVRTGPTITVGTVSITIQQLPGESSRELAQRVLEQFRSIAMSQTGDSLQLGSFT